MSFGNRRKTDFLDKFPSASIDSDNDKLASKCKFNFSYFVKDQEAGQDFRDWTNEQLVKLMEKLVFYSNETLEHWERKPIGKKKGHILEVYDTFPKKSDFTHPKHVPHQVKWARFRLESSVRLVGFVIPDEYNQKKQDSSGYHFCSNTFYVVFLDKDHKFYKTK
ncbi:TPA: hypothetical protein ACGF8L_002563 [Vibrio cholerae]|uniref:hypothetical protein n=1 Tax=Vibrio cholerae TaxID=666 RepID=UPI000E6C289B|nr:hypothetical protein [Vibrio cholerae]EGR2529388.1 hypothetical protein [Vibrio cholerae]EGR4178494.1 hypothetical protein [Vibrio cholerae]RJK88676.1 hypothetical protein CHN44_07235 [Vibrio cholerae]TYA79706.1 hypothetical protein FXE31_17390 [Vibrio cholerae]GHY38528.1 hypothetical protein VCSRO23_1645 [Vibrio cholerae]